LFCQNGRIGGGSRAADGFPRGAAPGRGLAERVVIGADRALAARQRPALVAIHGGKLLPEIGEDDGHLLGALRSLEDRPRHVGRDRYPVQQQVARFAQHADARHQALAGAVASSHSNQE